MPARASLPEQLLVRNLPPLKLHPNPSDEFCMAGFGPNDEIIDKYMGKIRHNQKHNLPVFDEPLIVEKMKPDGYMLINGHHRWAAALLLGLKKVPVRVVNMTHIEDILEMLEKSDRTKRAAINLDDVVFCQGDAGSCEKPLPFPLSLIWPERIRKGIPALCYTLQNEGYDVLVYSSAYPSSDHVNTLFRHHRIYVTGFVNGTEREKSWHGNDVAKVKALMEKKYHVTLNIDTDSISWIRSDTKEFDQIPVNAGGEEWAKEVISRVRELKDL